MQVGRAISRVEGYEKVTGGARYTADVPVPDLAYAVVVPSEVAHGRVTAHSLRTCAERAFAAPGALHVLTPLNCPLLHVLPRDFTDDLPIERRPPLSDLTVQHVGQHMAVVVADTLENATEAASMFDLEYLPEQPLLTARDVLNHPAAPDEKDGQIRHGSYLPDHFVNQIGEKLQDRRGDDDEPNLAARVSAHYSTPVTAPYPIELLATIAAWDGDVLTIHDSTRWLTMERQVVAAHLGVSADHIRLLSPLVGGAFGSKNFVWMHVVLCAVAAREVRRPVKLVLTRDQMFSSASHRPRTDQHVVLVADDSGVLASTEHHTVTETSTVGEFCEPSGRASRFLYRSPRLVVSHRVARINGPTHASMRGPGEASGLFALEVAIDELAHRLGIDPLQLRVRNHIGYYQPSGQPWSSKHLLKCYESGARRFSWQERPSTPRSLRRDGVQVGWGMATATHLGLRAPAGCRVVSDENGRVRFASATHELGSGVRTVMTQVAADASGLPLGRVSFESGDTLFPDGAFTGASATTATVGTAVFKAAGLWKQRLLELISAEPESPFFGADPAILDVVSGAAQFVGDRSQSVPVERFLQHGGQKYADALSFTAYSDPPGHDGPVSQSFGAHFCEVEVDEQLGRASVSRWVGVFDCGRILNPKLARSQAMGAITFGVGMALLEQVPYDPHTGQLLGEYYLPTHTDRPRFDISFIGAPDYALDPIGVRGVGEIGICGAAAAIANAIFHATGRRIRDLPITVEQLMTPDEGPP